MTRFRRCLSLAIVSLLTANLAIAAEATYTAQRKPRITVLKFEDTNQDARDKLYGESVSAMLVTFLKRKSQFVVVERQKLDDVLDEWKLNQTGVTNLTSGDQSSRELLEKLDGILMGSVTYINDRIEIDAKLLSRQDGRIIAATQRGGSIGCLRQTVERLGTAIEQEFLRPFYGRLKITIPEPQNVKVFLTPILPDNALDEEKPPAELSVSVSTRSEGDLVRQWITDPTTLEIGNILSGWYTLRLERPGYEGVGAENSRFEYRSDLGEVVHRLSGLPIARQGEESRFLVNVVPLELNELTDLGDLELRKRSGSFAFDVRRQYIDREYGTPPEMRILVASRDLALDQPSTTDLVPADKDCSDYLSEDRIRLQTYPDVRKLAGQRFDLGTFPGGELWIEDYTGFPLPAGKYVALTWAPNHQIYKTGITVNDLDREKTTPIELLRQTATLDVQVTERRRGNVATIACEETGFTGELPLDFEPASPWRGVPLDRCTVRHDVPGFGNWSWEIDLMPRERPSPPTFETVRALLERGPEASEIEPREEPKGEPVPIKTRLWIGGRLAGATGLNDVHFDRGFLPILLELLDDFEFEAQGSRLDQQRKVESLIVAAPRVGPADQTPRGRMLEALEDRLKLVDLLWLDGGDLARIRKVPELASRIKAYLDGGGALSGVVSTPGDYSSIFGPKLSVSGKADETDKLELWPGRVPQLSMQVKKDIGKERKLPKFEHQKDVMPGWRVVAFRKKNREPQIVELGEMDEGGYALVWAEDLDPIRDQQDVTNVRVDLFNRALVWAQYLMYRRLDAEGSQLAEARQQVGTKLGNAPPGKKGRGR